jgi:hypothetical protein
MPIFDELRDWFRLLLDGTDSESEKAQGKIEALMSVSLRSQLEMLCSDDNPDFEKYLRLFLDGKIKDEDPAHRSKPAAQAEPIPTPSEKAPARYPDVLPWPPNKDGTADFPDYGIDFRSIPHGLGKGRGRKKGELRMDRYYRGKVLFISRYRLSHRDGTRRSLTPSFCARMRTHAEAVFRKTNLVCVRDTPSSNSGSNLANSTTYYLRLPSSEGAVSRIDS